MLDFSFQWPFPLKSERAREWDDYYHESHVLKVSRPVRHLLCMQYNLSKNRLRFNAHLVDALSVSPDRSALKALGPLDSFIVVKLIPNDIFDLASRHAKHYRSQSSRAIAMAASLSAGVSSYRYSRPLKFPSVPDKHYVNPFSVGDVLRLKGDDYIVTTLPVGTQNVLCMTDHPPNREPEALILQKKGRKAPKTPFLYRVTDFLELPWSFVSPPLLAAL